MSTEQNAQSERLRTVLETKKIKQITLAEQLSVSRSYISNMVNGISPITISICILLARSYPSLNIRWLLTGDGEMELTNPMAVSEPTPEYIMMLPKNVPKEVGEILMNLDRRIRALEKEVIAKN